MRGGEVRAGRREGLGWWRHTRGMHGDGPAQGLGAKGTRRAHVEHEAHGRDAGGVPARNVRVEARQVTEEGAHVSNGRDVPVRDEAVRHSGGSWVSVELLDRGLQGGLGCEGGRAGPGSPAQAIASGGEGRGACPRAADEQLVGRGQGVCALPRVERGACNRGYCACREAGERVRGGGEGMHGARLKAWEPRARAERTKNMRNMSVTLEVSKLSGWLKADADCRVEGRACDAGGRGASREAGGPGVVAAHKRHARGWPGSRLGGQGHAQSARGT